jgi:sec-independent protein translocase protein TatA
MQPILALFNLGGGEIILILAVVLILFGAKRLPELAKGLGQGIREFKKVASDETALMSNHMPAAARPTQSEDAGKGILQGPPGSGGAGA